MNSETTGGKYPSLGGDLRYREDLPASFIVGPEEEYSAIQDAIDAAQKEAAQSGLGQTVVVRRNEQGQYTENLVLSGRVQLVADAPKPTTESQFQIAGDIGGGILIRGSLTLLGSDVQIVDGFRFSAAPQDGFELVLVDRAGSDEAFLRNCAFVGADNGQSVMKQRAGLVVFENSRLINEAVANTASVVVSEGGNCLFARCFVGDGALGVGASRYAIELLSSPGFPEVRLIDSAVEGPCKVEATRALSLWGAVSSITTRRAAEPVVDIDANGLFQAVGCRVQAINTAGDIVVGNGIAQLGDVQVSPISSGNAVAATITQNNFTELS